MIVSVLLNPQKKAAFTVDERKAMAREALSHLPNVKVNSFSGLLVDFLPPGAEQDHYPRAESPFRFFEYEFQLALMNRQLAPEIEALFIVTEARYSYLSSHAVKEIYGGSGGPVHEMVPPECSPSSGTFSPSAKYSSVLMRGRRFVSYPGVKTPVRVSQSRQAPISISESI